MNRTKKEPKPPMKNISVRFTAEEIDKIQEMSERYSVPQATVIRWGIETLLSYAARSNGKITLPISWDDVTPAHLSEPQPEYNK